MNTEQQACGHALKTRPYQFLQVPEGVEIVQCIQGQFLTFAASIKNISSEKWDNRRKFVYSILNSKSSG